MPDASLGDWAGCRDFRQVSKESGSLYLHWHSPLGWPCSSTQTRTDSNELGLVERREVPYRDELNARYDVCSLVHGEPLRDMAAQDGVRAVGSRPNDDLGLGQRRFARPNCLLFVRTARQG
jgi:hypothetical protein